MTDEHWKFESYRAHLANRNDLSDNDILKELCTVEKDHFG